MDSGPQVYAKRMQGSAVLWMPFCVCDERLEISTRNGRSPNGLEYRRGKRAECVCVPE